MRQRFKFEMQVASRFLLENRGQTVLILLGIAIGVAVMVFLTALIDGLQANLIEKTVGRSPHITITRTISPVGAIVTGDPSVNIISVDARAKENNPIVDWFVITQALRQDAKIKAVLPVLDGPALIRHGSTAQSIALRGMNMEEAEQIYKISQSIVDGTSQLQPGTVLVGTKLAEQLNLAVGSPVTLETTGNDPFIANVAGIFDLGVETLNNRWVLADRQRVSYLLALPDRVSEIEIQVNDVFQASAIAREWSVRLPGYKVESWQETNAALLSGLQSQTNSSYTIQFFVLLAVTLGISSVLAISAVQKSKQIGILKAMGIRTDSVSRIFIIQGAVLGIGGDIAGNLFGALLAQLFIVFASSGAGFSLLFKPLTLVIISMVTVIAATVAAYLPARKVARLNPIEVIRNG